MKLWPKALDSMPLHIAVTVALFAVAFGTDWFLLPAKPWMPAEAAFAAPISFACWGAIFAWSALSVIYAQRVEMGLAPRPFGRPARAPRPARSFETIVGCFFLGLASSMAVGTAALVVKMLIDPATATLGDQPFARWLFLGCFATIAPTVAVSSWMAYARSLRRGSTGAQAA